MKIVQQGWTWHTLPMPYKDMVFSISRAARNCYNSDLKSFEEEEKFIKNLIKRGHHSPLEHVSLSLLITTNRRVSHELVRHRLASYSQSSQRYIRYDEVEFIEPIWLSDEKSNDYLIWMDSCDNCETDYKALLLLGWQPQQAGEVLNNSVKTSIVTTCNLREWRHIIKLRTAKDAHPQMVALMTSILNTFKQKFPVFFEDI